MIMVEQKNSVDDVVQVWEEITSWKVQCTFYEKKS